MISVNGENLLTYIWMLVFDFLLRLAIALQRIGGTRHILCVTMTRWVSCSTTFQLSNQSGITKMIPAHDIDENYICGDNKLQKWIFNRLCRRKSSFSHLLRLLPFIRCCIFIIFAQLIKYWPTEFRFIMLLWVEWCVVYILWRYRLAKAN